MNAGYGLALLSGLLQAIGYIIYVRGSLRREIEPNGATWMMFAYDTTLLVILHATLGANFTILLLPAVCATCSIGVAVLGWLRAGFRWPEQRADRAALVSCLLLTAGYVGLTVLLVHGLISRELHRNANIALVIFSNGSTCMSFVPLLRSVWRDPASERPAAWLVWASAYALLLASTLMHHGWLEPELAIYPICNVLLHVAVAWLSSPWRRFAFAQGRGRAVGLPGQPRGSIGTEPARPNASSSIAAAASSPASPRGWPTICSPTGSPPAGEAAWQRQGRAGRQS